MRKLLKFLPLLFLASAANSDIAVTPGSGKTVATVTDNGRELQQVVVTTTSVTGIDGVARGVGYTSQSSSMPVNVLNTVPVTGTFWQTTQPVSGTVTADVGAGTRQVNLTQISSTTVKTSGTAGEQLVSVEISASSNTVAVSSFGIVGIDGTSRGVGYASQSSSVPVNVLNTLTVNTHAVTQSGAWTLSNLNGVVISSFASTALPMSNVVMIASSPVKISGTAGEQLVSVEIAGSSNTVIISSMGVLDIGGVSRPLGYSAPSSSMPVNVLNTVTITGSIANTTFASTQSGAWTLSNLNGVVISSFAATVGPMENLVMVASSPVKISGTAGEQLVSVEIAGSSNTVIVSSLSVINNAGASVPLGWSANSSSMPVASAGPAVGVALASTNPTFAGVYVASSTFPTLRTNGQGQFQLADPAGRTISVGGVPSWMVKTATITLTGTTPITLISSAASANFNDLCGCIGTNTSATNTYVTFQSTGALGGGWPASDFTLGMPANDVPVGFGPMKCENAIPQRAAAANWLVQAANAVTDLRLACYYYTIAR